MIWRPVADRGRAVGARRTQPRSGRAARRVWTMAAAVALQVAGGCASLPSAADPNQAIIDAVARVLPAVVDIQVFATGPAVRVLGRERRGSGVVFTDEGHVLTASHVVTGAEKLDVTFSDGRRASGRLTAIDPETGLAVVHVAPFSGMVVAPMGSSAGLKLGQACVALSSQGRELRAASVGVISGFAPFEGYWEYRLDRVVQTDAVMGPGSSGAPLLDAQGRVVAVLSFSPSDAQRTNFAIPVDLITGVLDDMIRNGRVQSRAPRPWFGTYTVSADGGVGVVAVLPGSPAERAGLRQRDLILQVNGVPVDSREAFYRVVWEGRVGDPFEFIVRRDDQNLSLTVRGEDRRDFFTSPLQERIP